MCQLVEPRYPAACGVAIFSDVCVTSFIGTSSPAAHRVALPKAPRPLAAGWQSKGEDIHFARNDYVGAVLLGTLRSPWLGVVSRERKTAAAGLFCNF